MICVVIKGPTFEKAQQQIESAFPIADLFELRLDLFDTLEIIPLKKLKQSYSKPLIFTLRSALQSGAYKEDEEERLRMLKCLASLKPDYLDLEYHVPEHFVKDIANQYPEIKLILSYHDFEKTPLDLDALQEKIEIKPPCLYKLALMPQSTNDTLRLLCWKKSKLNHLLSLAWVLMVS